MFCPTNTKITPNKYVSMPAKNQKKRRISLMPIRTSEVLDVKMAAELLTVSPDTVYDLFKRGELPGRKVGRKWLTTSAQAIERGEKEK
ncbi:MAG TPA: helix-turn-helix domain-containing protein [Gammaproteobacteria bacterium]|nr:helix-turn-helix domain-containing protein [Gammaproteobacteria bacterium]